MYLARVSLERSAQGADAVADLAEADLERTHEDVGLVVRLTRIRARVLDFLERGEPRGRETVLEPDKNVWLFDSLFSTSYYI